MVSVIVPVYNVEEYLPRCIDSILAQTYQNLEIILVDDGSPDNCGEICDKYIGKDNRIKVIHKENGGLSSARNAGLNIAQGTYISFVDSDDWVDPTFVECLRSALRDVNADMSACTFCRTRGNEAQRTQFKQGTEQIVDKKYDCAFSEKSYAGYACNKMFKRDIIENNRLRFDEKIFNGEDFPFTLEYLQYTQKIAFVKEDLYYYFFRETSIMQSIRLTERFMTILYAREKALAFLKEKHEPCYDVCKAAYLDILSKIKFMAMIDKDKYRAIYNSVQKKLKDNRKGLLALKSVGIKNKLRLLAMIYFPSIAAKMYYKKVKVV